MPFVIAMDTPSYHSVAQAHSLSKQDSVADSTLQLEGFLRSELLDFVYVPENEATPFSPTLFSAPPTDEIDAERAFPAPPTDETHRFGKALSKQELEQALRKRVPQNMQKATNWG